jgi:taurine dioxygenase
MVHPTTHRRAIYVNTMFTNRIVELDPDKSDRLLERLFLLMSQPEYVYEHRWTIWCFGINLASSMAENRST